MNHDFPVKSQAHPTAMSNKGAHGPGGNSQSLSFPACREAYGMGENCENLSFFVGWTSIYQIFPGIDDIFPTKTYHLPTFTTILGFTRCQAFAQPFQHGPAGCFVFTKSLETMLWELEVRTKLKLEHELQLSKMLRKVPSGKLT